MYKIVPFNIFISITIYVRDLQLTEELRRGGHYRLWIDVNILHRIFLKFGLNFMDLDRQYCLG